MASQVLMKRGSLEDKSPSSATREDAGVEIGRAEGAGQRASLFIPALFENLAPASARAGAPSISRGRSCSSPRRDAGEPVAGRPAQRRRIGVGARAGAIFPNARVGLESIHDGSLAKTLEQPNSDSSPILGRRSSTNICVARENDAAINVVLPLRRRLVADAHRPMPEKALEIRRDRLPQAG